MELYGENDFKIRSYQSAVRNLENYSGNLSELKASSLEQIDGVGKSIAAVISEINKNNNLQLYEDYLAKTPEGILEMMQLSGFGPKKIKLIWEQLKVETLEGLLEACDKHQIAPLKGFGDKTEEKLKEAIVYKLSMRGYLYFRDAEILANSILNDFQQLSGLSQASVTGELRRKMEIIKPFELIVATSNKLELINYFRKGEGYIFNPKESGPFAIKVYHQASKVDILIYLATAENYINELFRTTAHPKHLAYQVEGKEAFNELIKDQKFISEEAIYQEVNLPYIAPELREGLWEFGWAVKDKIPKLVELDQLKGVLHNHSTYSDGKNTLEQMAVYCKELGYEYLGISDHSKTAAYANGLQEFRINKQHEEIDLLNQKLAPFKIFKGIESDILNDGSLDYADNVLASFDFIVASIHSPLRMDEKTATKRLITAIANPFTTILGHPTGRLLLQRKAYPINHYAVIDACANYGVVIEINAHPFRLDLDWRYVRYALDKGVPISINPDAHETIGYHDMYYGICVGRKAGLTASETLNAKSCQEITVYFNKRKQSALAKV